MNINFIHNLMKWLNHILKTDIADYEVFLLKEKTIDKVNQTTDILKEQAHLQREVIHKTTTYYLGRAMGKSL